MKLRYSLFLLTLCSSLGVTKTLTQVLEETLKKNPILEEQIAKVDQAKLQLKISKSNYYPKVDLKGFIENNPDGNGTPKEISLNLTQNLYEGGKTKLGKSLQEIKVKQAELDFKSKEEVFLLEVIEEFLNVKVNQILFEINSHNEIVLKKHLEAVKNKLEAGESTPTDVAQSEARLAGAKASKEESFGNQQISKEVFQRLTQLEPRNLGKIPNIPNLQIQMSSFVEKVRSNNKSILLSKKKVNQSKTAIQEAKANFYPKFDLYAKALYGNGSTGNEKAHIDGVIGISLSLPLFEGGKDYYRYQESIFKNTEDQKNQVNTELRVIQSAKMAVHKFRFSRAKVLAFEAQRRASQKALLGVKRERDAGVRTLLDVLDAEQELLDSKVNLIKAKKDVLSSYFQILQYKGELNLKTIGDSLSKL